METKHKIFKPFDEVLVRDHDGRWYCALYSFFMDKYHVTSHINVDKDEDIIPYEGNEYLVGTNNEPEEEIKLEEGEVAVFCDVLNFLSEFTGISKFKHTNPSSFKTINGNVWTYAIKFSDFNPENMEETKKHILCVRNGRIIRYKE